MSIWHVDDKPKRQGILHRLVRAITLTLAAAFLMSGYLGLRALVWEHPGDLSRSLLAGLVAGGAVGGALNLIYIIAGTRLWHALGIDGLSVQIGALVGMGLYGGYNALASLLRGANDLTRMALQGGIDGLLIGAIAGVLVAFVSGGGVEFSRAGCVRYVLLFFGMLLLLGVGVLVESLTNAGLLAFAVVAALLIVVKVGLRRVFKRRAAQTQIDDDSFAHPATTMDVHAAYGYIDDDGYGDETQRSTSTDGGSIED